MRYIYICAVCAYSIMKHVLYCIMVYFLMFQLEMIVENDKLQRFHTDYNKQVNHMQVVFNNNLVSCQKTYFCS